MNNRFRGDAATMLFMRLIENCKDENMKAYLNQLQEDVKSNQCGKIVRDCLEHNCLPRSEANVVEMRDALKSWINWSLKD